MRLVRSIAIAFVLLASTLPAMALMGWQQHRSAPAPPRPNASATTSGSNPQSKANSPGGMQFRLNGPGPHRGAWLRKYGNMPPSQQEQQLQRDPNFQSLPADKQQQLLNRLRSFNSLPPEKRATILDRMETFEHLTPAQQETAKGLFQQYRSLPEDRKSKVSQAFRELRSLPPDQRNQLLSSDEYRNNFSDEERELLRGMTNLNYGPSHTD